MRRNALVVVLSLATLARSPSALAQGNDRSSPTGGRSALMGNTGVALGRDGAAPFLNPATIVRISDHSIAFSVNFFSLSYTHFNQWHEPANVDASRFGNVALSGTGETTNAFKALPSTLCLFFTVAGLVSSDDDSALWKRGKQKLAICLGTLEAQEVALSALSFHGTTSVGTTAQVQSLNRDWNRLYVGPTYSVALSDVLSIGASLHGALTSDSFALNGSSLTSASGGGAIQSALGIGGLGHALDITLILGGAYRVGPVTFGASAQVPALHIFGNYQGNFNSQYATGTTDTATVSSGTGDFHSAPPIRLAAGAGIEGKSLTLELDGSYDFPQSEAIGTSVNVNTSTLTSTGATPSTLSASYIIPSRGVVNAGAGAEYFLSPTFSVLGGISTSLTSLGPIFPTPTIGNLAQARTNWVNLSFGIGSYGKAEDLLIGAQVGYGWGQTLAVNPYVVPNDFVVIDTQSFAALVVLAGSTNLRTLARAVNAVEHIVTDGKPADAPK
jgi:hypothetical protein